jgi:uncharacterized protein
MQMATVTGARIDLMQPDPFSFRIYDIAHGLSREGRFSNQTDAAYSVGQHSLLVEQILAQHVEHGQDKTLLMMALLHDAHEFITRDISTPFAHALEQIAPGALDELKHRYQCCIWQLVGLSYEEVNDPGRLQLVKWADSLALLMEKEDLAVDTFAQWPQLSFLHRPSWLNDEWATVRPQPPEQVMSAFIDRFLVHVMARDVPHTRGWGVAAAPLAHSTRQAASA